MKTRLYLRLIPALIGAALTTLSVRADVVYVTSNTSNCTATAVCGNAVNPDFNINGTPVFNDNALSSYTSALASTPDKPLNAGGARFFSNSFSNTAPDLGVTISPTLAVTGGVYRVSHVFSSTANNVSTDIIVGVTNTDGCTISFDESVRFQRSFGQPAPQQWQLLGFLTNNADTATPAITFYYKSGVVSAGAQARLLMDTFRFTLYEPCTDVPTVGVTGPLATNLSTVVVTGVTNATEITVYQDSGSGMVEIGSKTTDITDGNNTITVSGLVRGAQVAATQTVGGQEGCVPPSGVLVGGGANPTLRIALTIRDTTNTTATIGEPAATAGQPNLHFLGATTVSGGAPVDAAVVYPSNDWQTVTFSTERQFVGNASNAVGTVAGPGVYNPNDSVEIRVYAFRTVPETGTLIYSRVEAQSAAVTSNDVFAVNWTWTAAPDAEGYRILRSINSFGYVEFVDVFGVNNLTDDNFIWQVGDTVTPKSAQLGSSIQWNPAVGNPNSLTGSWGALESINFVIDNLEDTGPFDLYVDNIQNGSTVFQTFEEATAGQSGYGFQPPSFSGTTSANIMTAPNLSQVSDLTADTGGQSLRVRFQWNGLTATKWLRLTTASAAPASNPYLNLDEPISFRLLLLPVGATPPQPLALTISQFGTDTVLDWPGTHTLQAASAITGTFTNVPGVTAGPYTNTFTEPQKFFRLVD
jgi:hypothetical protein